MIAILLFVLFAFTVLIYEWNTNIMFAVWLESHLLRASVIARVVWFGYPLICLFIPEFFEVNYALLSSDYSILETSSIHYSISDLFSSVIYSLLPAAAADEGDVTPLHSSLSALQSDSSLGGSLVMQSILNVDKQLGDNIPVYLTSKGILAAQTLSNMLNDLKASDFGLDSQLLTYLSDSVNMNYTLHFDIQSTTVNPNNVFTLPLGELEVPNMHDSGVYGFFFTSMDDSKLGLGSALSCEARLNDHINSFKGRRIQQFMHKYVMTNGGLANVMWSPLITSPNLVHNWHTQLNSFNISLGASNTLTGFAQFPIRVLEQGMMDKYHPGLNPNAGNVTFFNFAHSSTDFNVAISKGKNYQAFDATMTNVLVEGDSYNSISKKVGLSNISVRNNMDWHLGVEMTIKGETVQGYLREKGVPLRTEPLLSQLTPKGKLPTVELTDRTLYDLIPGKLHAISVDTLQDFGLYDNERDLWLSLNPGDKSVLEGLKGKDGKNYLNNRVGRYMNVSRPEGNLTELGNFHFCRHPDFLAGMAKSATALYSIHMVTGLCTYYANISQAGPTRTTTRNKLNDGTLYNGTTRFVYDSTLVKYLPELNGIQTEVTLSKQQLSIINTIPGAK